MMPTNGASVLPCQHALSAINLLQRSYDTAWFSRLSAGKVSNLLAP
jgi:hypothetical protein